MHLLVNSTGIKVEGEGEWNARKHGGMKRRVWRKIHIRIGEKALETQAVQFTISNVSGARMPLELLDQIPPDQEIANITADGAFDTRECYNAIAPRGGTAIIPLRKNATPWKSDTAGAIAHNDILRTSKRVGRTIGLLSPPQSHRDQDALRQAFRVEQIRPTCRPSGAEFQIRVTVLNGFTALGTHIIEIEG